MESMNIKNIERSLKLEHSALQGMSQCHVQLKEYQEAMNTSERAINIFNQLVDEDEYFCKKKEYFEKNEKIYVDETKGIDQDLALVELTWTKQMTNYQLLSFSHFYLSQYEETLKAINDSLSFSKNFLKYCSCHEETSITSTKKKTCQQSLRPLYRPLQRNKLLLKLLLLKNQVLLKMSVYDVDELNQVWEDIATCADCFVVHQDFIQAGKLYKMSGEYFTTQSGRSAYDLDDKTYQNATNSCQRANELTGLAAKYTKKYNDRLMSELREQNEESLNLEQRDKIVIVIHKHYIVCIRLLFLQGLCAEDLGRAQRHFEAALTMSEEYERIKNESSSLLSPVQDIVLQEEYSFLCGDVHHHLAFTYMKCGKLKYALEEIENAIQTFEEVNKKYESEEIDNDKSGEKSIRWQALLFVLIVLFSFTYFGLFLDHCTPMKDKPGASPVW